MTKQEYLVFLIGIFCASVAMAGREKDLQRLRYASSSMSGSKVRREDHWSLRRQQKKEEDERLRTQKIIDEQLNRKKGKRLSERERRLRIHFPSRTFSQMSWFYRLMELSSYSVEPTPPIVPSTYEKKPAYRVELDERGRLYAEQAKQGEWQFSCQMRCLRNTVASLGGEAARREIEEREEQERALEEKDRKTKSDWLISLIEKGETCEQRSFVTVLVGLLDPSADFSFVAEADMEAAIALARTLKDVKES